MTEKQLLNKRKQLLKVENTYFIRALLKVTFLIIREKSTSQYKAANQLLVLMQSRHQEDFQSTFLEDGSNKIEVMREVESYLKTRLRRLYNG